MHDGARSATKLSLMVQLGLLQLQDIQHLQFLGLFSEPLRMFLIMRGSGLPYHHPLHHSPPHKPHK